MKNTIFEIILTIIPLIVTAITILIWYLKGYDEKLNTKGYLYHPPKGSTTLEVGYIYKGEVKEKYDLNFNGNVKVEMPSGYNNITVL